MYWVIAIIILVTFIYFSLIKPLHYWAERGIPQLPISVILNEFLELVWPKDPIPDRLMKFYNTFKGKRYFGSYQAVTPTIFLLDLDVIKQITVKDFEHFLDHYTFIPDDVDPLWGKNLFALTGQKWRHMRSTLSPVFTSSKIKHMFVLINENAEEFSQHFIKEDKDIIEVEMKDIMTRFANDVIASAAFGLKFNSLVDKDNEFYINGKKAVNMASASRVISMIILIFFPKLFKLLGLTFSPKSISNFFINIVTQTIKDRETNGIIRPDLINILMEARKYGLEIHDDDSKDPKVPKMELTDIDITAQALIFFFAGFESIATLMTFMGYELAINPDIQERLLQEIEEVAEQCNGKPKYEDIQKMKYLDMVTSEALRKWPNVLGVDRVCTKQYTLRAERPDEISIDIPKGRGVWIPIYCLHMDPEYFPEPYRFDPERFSDENKPKIKPYSYLPFGSGPRNCIGSRFALLETKILYFYLLRNFQLVPVEKTEIPIKLSKRQFNLAAENGIWIGLKRRITTEI